MLYWKEIIACTTGNLLSEREDTPIKYLLTDSRKIITSSHALFVAIQGERHDGHQYIELLYQKGIRYFITEKKIDVKHLPEAGILVVPSGIEALQKIAAYRRSKFQIPVIGITGSNGKTIV